MLLVGALLLTACTGADSTDTSSTAAPTTAPVCPQGAPDRPTEISRLTLDGVTAETFATTLTVPFAGLEAGPLDRPSVVRASVVTATSGAPVTFRADTGRVLETLDDGWPTAPSQVTVFSVPGTTSCVASVYLLSTRTGTLTLTVESIGSLTTTLEVLTSPSAARNVSLEVGAPELLAGEDLDATVTVTDVFGNRVANSVVIISVPRDGPALYLNGTNRATVLTDERGRARVQLVTVPDRGDRLTVRARGADPRCSAQINQFGCTADQPFLGASEAVSDVKTRVAIDQPEVIIDSPAAGTRLSAGQTFDIRARTLGVASGTLAQVKLGDEVLALGSVEEEGLLSVSGIIARVSPRGVRYGLLVGSLPRVVVEITVVPFGIIEARPVDDRLELTVATGAWPAGTTLQLLGNGQSIRSTEVDSSGDPWLVEIADGPGTYLVRARAGDEVVDSPDPLIWP